MSSEAFGAAADSLVVLDTAVSALSTRSIARVGAFQVETGQVAAALLMLRTLWVTARERIAQEVGRARTDGAVIRNTALGVGTARRARVVAAEVDASLVRATLEVALALMFAAVDWVAEVAIAARAHGTSVLHPAVGVSSARCRRAEIRTE